MGVNDPTSTPSQLPYTSEEPCSPRRSKYRQQNPFRAVVCHLELGGSREWCFRTGFEMKSDDDQPHIHAATPSRYTYEPQLSDHEVFGYLGIEHARRWHQNECKHIGVRPRGCGQRKASGEEEDFPPEGE